MNFTESIVEDATLNWFRELDYSLLHRREIAPGETPFRGELRSGDHAEFTLLERKNRSTRLDEARLFATQEPCAPGARNHPKLSCADNVSGFDVQPSPVLGIPTKIPTMCRDSATIREFAQLSRQNDGLAGSALVQAGVA